MGRSAKLETVKERYFCEMGSGELRSQEITIGKMKAQVVVSAASQPDLRGEDHHFFDSTSIQAPIILGKEA